MQTIPTLDLYRELEVDPAATPATIAAAWKALLKRHHPDVAEDPASAVERVKRLNLARDWLLDPERRALYDRARADGRVSFMPRDQAAGSGPRPERSFHTVSPSAPRTERGRPTGASVGGSAPGPGAHGPRAAARDAVADLAGPTMDAGYNPYREFARAGREPSAPPDPASAGVRRSTRGSKISLVASGAFASILIVFAAASFLNPDRGRGGIAGVSSPPFGPVRTGTASSLIAGLPSATSSVPVDTRLLPAPELSNVVKSCLIDRETAPFRLPIGIRGQPGVVYVVPCLDGTSFGPIVYVADATAWRLVSAGGKVDGHPAAAFRGGVAGTADEFGIAWTRGDEGFATLSLYRPGRVPARFWDSTSIALQWLVPSFEYRGDDARQLTGSLFVTSVDPAARATGRFHGEYRWLTVASVPGLHLVGSVPRATASP